MIIYKEVDLSFSLVSMGNVQQRLLTHIKPLWFRTQKRETKWIGDVGQKMRKSWEK